MVQNIEATMMIHWMQALALMVFAMHFTHCCHTRDIIYQPDPETLAPNQDPPRMLGWEQMILMFQGPRVRIF